MTPRRLTRRALLGQGLAAAAAIGFQSALAACGGQGGQGAEPPLAEAPPEPLPGATPTFTGPLRISGLFGPSPEEYDLLARELGFEVVYEASPGGVTGVERALTAPETFDVLSAGYYDLRKIWPAGNLIGIDRTKIARWDRVEDLFKLGKLTPADDGCTVGEGAAPFRLLYTTSVEEPGGEIVQWGGDDGSGPREGLDEPPGVTLTPSTFGVDTLGYNADVLMLEPTEVSWGELLNARWRGRVAVFDEPLAGWQETGLAARALGLLEIADLGNMTVEEMDALAAILLELKDRGHFRAFWPGDDPNQSFELMASGEVVVESMWPIVGAALAAQGLPIRLALPIEGFRGWASGHGISKEAARVPGRLEACYDFINFVYGGYVGGLVMPLGFYHPVQEAARAFVAPGEYGYWIEGEPADRDYAGPFGELSVREGQIRDGGSFEERLCKYATWNAIFDEAEHQLERWQEIVAS